MTTSALGNRNYRIFIAGAVVSLHGLWIYRVALGWLAWQLSHSELWVGVVAFTQFVPTFVLGPAFGVAADRFDRRVASIVINALSCLNILVLSVLAFRGDIDIRLLALLSLVQGTLDGAYAPFRMAIVPNLVREDQRHSAIALTSVAFNLSRFVGPAIAGPIIAIWGVGAAFAVNAVSYLSVVAAMFMISLPATAGDGQRKNPWQELVEGARYVATHPTIRLLLLLSLVRSMLGRGSLEMLPAFADAVFGGGAGALSILTSAIGAGAILVGVLLSSGTTWLTVALIRAGVIATGTFVVVLAAVGRLSLAVPVVVILGGLLTLGGVGSQILIQLRVDDHVRGRVSSFFSAVVFGGTSLGALLIGAAAHAWGLRIAVSAAGLACVAGVVAGMLLLPVSRDKPPSR